MDALDAKRRFWSFGMVLPWPMPGGDIRFERDQGGLDEIDPWGTSPKSIRKEL